MIDYKKLYFNICYVWGYRELFINAHYDIYSF
jgi:hypothetical protein